jgi:hypothetical protein
MLARATRALVHIDVTVAAKCTIGLKMLHALHHRALGLVLLDEIMILVGLSLIRVTFVLAHTISKASHTGALVSVLADARVRCRVSAGGTILARAANTLININIAIA